MINGQSDTLWITAFFLFYYISISHIPDSNFLHAGASNERWTVKFRVLSCPFQIPFLMHSVQLLVALNSNSHTSQFSPAHPTGHLSVQFSPIQPRAHALQFSPFQPIIQVSLCPVGPKLVVQSLQFSPVHPFKHWSHCPAGPKLVAHWLQYSPVHPLKHWSHCPGGSK